MWTIWENYAPLDTNNIHKNMKLFALSEYNTERKANTILKKI